MMQRADVNILRASGDTAPEIFRKLSELDKMVIPEGWSEESFRSEAEKDEGYVLYVMKNDVAAALLTGYSAVGEGDVTNVAVHPDFRRKGLARLLIDEFIKLLPEDTEAVFLEVRESNFPAKGLYESCGFQKIALRKNFYSFPRENAVVMKKILMEDNI